MRKGLTVDQVRGAVFAIHQRVEERPSDSDGSYAQTERFEHVGSTTNAWQNCERLGVGLNPSGWPTAVQIHLHAFKDFRESLVDLEKREDRRRGAIETTPALPLFS